jgi:MFS family permease
LKTPEENERLWSRDFIKLTLALFLISTAFYFLLPTLPVYVIEVMGVTNKQVGLLIAIYTLAAIIVRPFAGMAVDLYGRKTILISSVIVFTLVFLGYPWIGLFIPLLFLRFFHGLSWGVSTSAVFTTIVDIVPIRKRGRGLGYSGLSFNLAMAIGPVIGLAVMGKGRFTAMFLSAFAIAVAGSVIFTMVSYPRFSKPHGLKFNWKGMIAKRSVPVTLNVLVVTITFGGVLTFLSLYASELGLASMSGPYFTIMALGMGLARVFGGQVFDRFGPRTIVIAGLFLAMTGFFLMARLPYCSCFLASSFTIGVGLGIVVPIFQSMANNMVPRERRGVANSTFLLGLDLGIGVGSIFSGFIADIFSLSASYLFSVGIIALSLIMFFTYTMPHYRKYAINE